MNTETSAEMQKARDSEGADDRPPGPLRFAVVLRVAGPLAAAAWWVGALARDRNWATTFCYYFPPVVMAGVGAAWLILTRGRTRSAARGFMVLTTVAAVAKVGVLDCSWHPPPEPPAEARPFRFVHWNVARGAFRVDQVWRTLIDARPDVCLLSEAPFTPDLHDRLRSVVREGVVLVAWDMALVSRYPAEPTDRFSGSGIRAWSIRIRAPGGPFDLLAVDFSSSPFRDRRPPMFLLMQWLEARDGRVPLVIAGDFNIPRDSLRFDALRRQFRHAYETSGRGWPYSWPVPLPLYAIDHVWLSAGIQAATYRMATAPCSDHRRQAATLWIDGGAGR